MMGTIVTTVAIGPNNGYVVLLVLLTLAGKSVVFRLLSQVRRRVSIKLKARRWECTLNIRVGRKRQRKGAPKVIDRARLTTPSQEAAPIDHCGRKCECRSTHKKDSKKRTPKDVQ